MKFLPGLALALIVLKLCSVINWSWWLVILPLYGPAAFVIGVWILGYLGLLGVAGGSVFVKKTLSYFSKKS